MKIEVNVGKKYFFSILAIVLILAGVLAVYAYISSPGTVPNPGHALTTVQGYFENDVSLQNSLGKFCQHDGTNCQTSASQPELVVFQDDFLSGGTVSGEIGLFGWSLGGATGDYVGNPGVNHPGTFQYTQSDSAGWNWWLTPIPFGTSLSTTGLRVSANKGFDMTFIIRLGSQLSSDVNSIFYVGLVDDITGSPSKGYYFEKSNTNNWRMVAKNGASVDASGSGVAVDTSWVNLRIVKPEGTNTASYYINGNLVGARTMNLAGADLKVAVVKAGATSDIDVNIIVDYFGIKLSGLTR